MKANTDRSLRNHSMARALHFKASYWIRQGIFDQLRSFEAFEARVNEIPEEKDRGDIFEIFVEGYLATQTITQSVKHWVVGNIPLSLRERYKLPSDATGIDGLYETHDGSHVAYQVKYRQKQHLTFAEVAPFLGITEQFSDRVIFTNAERLSDKAATRTRWISAEAFRALSPDALSSIEAWLKTKPLPIVRLTPDPSYQSQALADIKGALAQHNSTTVVMACGTGKTLVALWAAERQTPKTVLVLVPSLTLLQQTLREWSEQTSWSSSFSYICVCSDPTVGLQDDAINPDKSDFEFRIDTDPTIVRRFLERQTTDIKVIFSTYQSSPVVGDGARGLPPFDFAVFDEAHKTIGLAGSAFGYALSDQNIRIRKRLFLTATPRHIDIRHRDKEGEFRVYSMDDETVYGPRAHTLSFGAAAQREIICRYKVIISLIDKAMVDDFTRRKGITLVEHDEVSARWMANLIAIHQAIEKVNATKIISFHSRVRLAQEFATNQPRGIAYHLRNYDVRHVNGEQSSAERADIVRSFSDAQKALLTNARCLTEGINIPAVDMIAFIDPRQSRVDITQAVGRAMRKPRGATNKTFGYVVVPVFAGMEDKDSLESAIRSEKFEAVVDVLNALQEHDEELVDIIREIKERKGEGETFNPRRLNEKVELIGPRIDLDRLTISIGVKIADRIGNSWDEAFGLLMRFRAREGHCRVPISHVEGIFKLGIWIANQRRNINTISAKRRQRLDDIGFVWKVFESKWEEGFGSLITFKAREGHCRVPQSHIDGTFKLGQWVTEQRLNKDTMSAERRQRLEGIGFVWFALEDKWEKGFSALTDFKVREGHCRVFDRHIEETFKLGQWIRVQRECRDTMSAERRQRLESIGFVWDPFESQWEEGFAALMTFRAREGHCRIPRDHVEGTFKFRQWLSVQRRNRDTMSAARRQRLDDIGFVWDPFESQWEEGFAVLTTFKAREGNCLVPADHIEGTFKLGTWVSNQRANKDAMSAERRQRLEGIGFVWFALEEKWEKGFSALTDFKMREGHCRVPIGHVEGVFKLGQWVTVQRKSIDSMVFERRQQLDAIGFVWDVLESQWEEGFSALMTFKARYGYCIVQNNHKDEYGFLLGRWVANQRSDFKSGKMQGSRIQRLNEVGFVWDVFDQDWSEGFRHLLDYKARYGGCLVPQDYTADDGFNLGIWVSNNRASFKGGILPADRERILSDIGFVWNKLEGAWLKGLNNLAMFKSKNGNCLVPNLYVTADGYDLGRWVQAQRQRYKIGKISFDRVRRLSEIGFVWNPMDAEWEYAFNSLKAYREQHGNYSVPRKYKCGNGLLLGKWVQHQRDSFNDGTLSADRIQRLNEIGFVWLPFDKSWAEGLEKLNNYKSHYGDCLVPQRFRDESGFFIGVWVANQRRALKANTLSPNRLKQLDAIGFVWDMLETTWEEGIAALTTFKKREGHSHVPKRHVEGIFKLGIWIANQRQNRKTMSAERRRRLDEIGFFWDPLENAWKEGFAALAAFKAREGHCSVPAKHIEGTFKLGEWVGVQRTKRDTMPADRRKRLDEIGFVWRAK